MVVLSGRIKFFVDHTNLDHENEPSRNLESLTCDCMINMSENYGSYKYVIYFTGNGLHI